MGRSARFLVCALLAAFYVMAASEHASRVNRIKARGDQTGYLIDAKDVYANWHTPGESRLIGVRNRMPMYAAALALFYSPAISDDAFFVRAKQVNIYLSLALLGCIWIVAARYLPPLAAANFTAVAAFGWFIFKAGYSQSELLFYTVFFFAFVASIELIEAAEGRRGAVAAVVAGLLCGVAHLTKAAMLPFVAIVLAVGVAQTALSAQWRRLTRLAIFAVVFIAVLWPYISTSHRVYGHYFYNVNSTFYVWYDDWAHASTGTLMHGDGEHWPDMPASELPGPVRYIREHSVAVIAGRVGDGFGNMGVVLRRDFDLLPYLALFLGTAVLIASTRRRETVAAVRVHTWSAVFVVVYGATYLLATAFYFPVSGTGTGRFLLAHALPFFFVISRFIVSPRLANASWSFGGMTLGVRHAMWLTSAVIAFNVVVRVWPRLMTTYGGF